MAGTREATKVVRMFFRPREICERYGATKPWVHKQIREGRLEARRVDGCVFVTAESVRRLFGEEI